MKLFQKMKSPHLFSIALVVIGIMLLFTPPTDPDFGWHFKYGEYFIQHGKVLNDNIFSYTFTDYKWINSYWLFEVLLYVTHQSMGATLAILSSSVAAAILMLGVVRYISKNKATQFLGYVYITGMLASYSIVVRPHVYSVMFMYFLLIALLYKKNLQKLLPIVFLIWANMHAEFVIGLFIYGLYTFVEFAQQLREKRFKTSLYILPIVSVLMTLINPAGIHLWLTLAKELTLPSKGYVQEWSHMKPDSLADTFMLGLIIAIFLLGSLSSKNQKPWYKFLVVFFMIFSVKSIYMARVFYMVASFGLLESVDTLVTQMANYFNDTNKLIIKKSMIFSSIFFFAVLAGNFFYKVYVSTSVERWSKYRKYPYEAVSYIKHNGIKGNLLNNYNWGGYLIWQLPEYKTFIDGRMTSWREGDNYFMADYYKLYDVTKPENQDFIAKTLKENNITTVLESPKSKLVGYLKTQGWKESYADDISVLLVR